MQVGSNVPCWLIREVPTTSAPRPLYLQVRTFLAVPPKDRFDPERKSALWIADKLEGLIAADGTEARQRANTPATGAMRPQYSAEKRRPLGQFPFRNATCFVLGKLRLDSLEEIRLETAFVLR